VGNANQQALEQIPDPMPARRVFRLPWRSAASDTPDTQIDVLADALTSAPADVPDQRVEDAADRAERAAGRASDIADQLAALVERLLGARGAAQVDRARPADEVAAHVGEATPGPMTRVAGVVARVVDVVAGTVYDYSGGRYGVAPLTSGDVRHERDRERKRAEPVAIIEEPDTERESGRSWPPLIAFLIALAAAVGVVIWRRDRARELAGVAAARGRVAMRRTQAQTRVTLGQARYQARQLRQRARDAAQRRSLIAAPTGTGVSTLETTGTSGVVVIPEVVTPHPDLTSADASSASGGISQPIP
jgi:hypothetical protein